MLLTKAFVEDAINKVSNLDVPEPPQAPPAGRLRGESQAWLVKHLAFMNALTAIVEPTLPNAAIRNMQPLSEDSRYAALAVLEFLSEIEATVGRAVERMDPRTVQLKMRNKLKRLLETLPDNEPGSGGRRPRRSTRRRGNRIRKSRRKGRGLTR
jgi:hypothetical protein